MDPIILAFLGYLIGALFRTLYHYLWKAVDNPEMVFDQKYLATMLISVILSIMSAAVTFTTISIPVDGAAYILLAAIPLGYMANDIVNKPVDHMSKKKAG